MKTARYVMYLTGMAAIFIGICSAASAAVPAVTPAPVLPTVAPGDKVACYGRCFLLHGATLYQATKNYRVNWNRAVAACCPGEITENGRASGLNGCAAPGDQFQQFSNCMMLDLTLVVAQAGLTVAEAQLRSCLDQCDAQNTESP